MSKTIRDSYKKPEERKHCCGQTLQNEGIGYDDLDELFRSPCDLIFTIENISIELAEEYERESWQLNEEEKIKAVEDYRVKGNELFKQNQFGAAEQMYSSALGIIEQLMLREKPKDVEWIALTKIKVPLLLNYAQCKLLEKDFYRVIECCTEVLSYEPENLKAFYRRGKGNSLLEDRTFPLEQFLSFQVMSALGILKKLKKTSTHASILTHRLSLQS